MLHHKGNSNWSLLTIKTQLLCAHDLQPFAIIQHGGEFSSNTSKVTIPQGNNSFYYENGTDFLEGGDYV